MEPTTTRIPILGLDQRPNSRLKTPGIADTLVNLRPGGVQEQPHWEPIPTPLPLESANNAGFTHPNVADIVRAGWHVRGRVGKHGNAGGSVKRLVVLFNTGVVQLIDPVFPTAWSVTASYSASSVASGNWDMTFTQMYDTGVISVSKGGVAVVDLVIEDDLLFEAVFPPLPVMRTVWSTSDEFYKDADFESGIYKGLLDGSVFVRYALVLQDGTLVKHSRPFEVGTRKVPYHHTALPASAPDGYFTSFLNCHFEGYDAYQESQTYKAKINPEDPNYSGLGFTPPNFDYWSDKLYGVAVLVSEFIPTPKWDDPKAWFKKQEALATTTWYELTTFEYIDGIDVPDQQRTKRFDYTAADILNLQTAGIDIGTHHLYAHGVSDTYNSRLIQANQRVDFARPTLGEYEGLGNFSIFVMHHPDIEEGPDSLDDRFFLFYNNLPEWLLGPDFQTYFTGTTDATSDFPGIGTKVTVVQFPQDRTGSVRLELGVYGQIDLDWPALWGYRNRVIDFADIAMDGNPVTSKVMVEVDIETDNGVFTRRLTDAQAEAPYVLEGVNITDGRGVSHTNVNAWQPYGGVIAYPDSRAKELRIYADQNGLNSWHLMESYKLTASKTSNFAFNYGPGNFVAMITGEATVTSPSAVTVNDDTYAAFNLVRASQTNSIFSFNPAQTYRVGMTFDPVTALAVNALEVSQGQFGQYPLYVFKKNEIYALEQSQASDVLFARISPIDLGGGVSSQQKVTNIDQAVVYANANGIFLLAGSAPVRISGPVSDIVPHIKTLGVQFLDNDSELLVGLGNNGGTYRYSTRHQRWYTDSFNVESCFRFNEELYTIRTGGFIFDYQKHQQGGDVPVHVRLNDVHFGYPDQPKRFYYFYLRAMLDVADGYTFTAYMNGVNVSSSQLQLQPARQSVFDVDLEIQANLNVDTDYIEYIDTKYVMRYSKLKSQ